MLDTSKSLEQVHSFFEQIENENLENEVMDVFRYDGKVVGYVKKLKLKNEIEEIIELLKDDLKTAKAVKIHIEISSQSSFLPLTISETIKTMTQNDCDVAIDSLINDKLNAGIICCILVYEDFN
jgi:predicted  nucleic acid-binding Zn ribbon protein